MDSLTCGIYPLIPSSDTGFPSHTHLQTAISYYRCCPSHPCSFLPLTRNSDVGTSEQTGMAKGVWPQLACGLAQTQRKGLEERAESGQQSQPARCGPGQRHAAQQSPCSRLRFPGAPWQRSAQTERGAMLMMRSCSCREVGWLKPPKSQPRSACMLLGRWELMLSDAQCKGKRENGK